jgi:hypothetical protein
MSQGNKPDWVKDLEYIHGRTTGPRHVSVIALFRFLIKLNVIKRPEFSVGSMIDMTRKYARRNYR